MKFASALCLSICASLSAQTLPLMPLPASVREAPGAVEITPAFTLSVSGVGAADARIKAAASRTLTRLARQTGIPITARTPTTAPNATLRIIVERPSELDEMTVEVEAADDLPREAYDELAADLGRRLHLAVSVRVPVVASADGPARRMSEAAANLRPGSTTTRASRPTSLLMRLRRRLPSWSRVAIARSSADSGAVRTGTRAPRAA